MSIQSRILLTQNKKKCSCCHEIKDISEFHKCNARHDGLKEYCKICKKIKEQSRWLQIKNNPKKLNQRKKIKKKWDLENIQYRREYRNNYFIERRKNDIKFRILTNLRNRIVKVLKGTSKSKSTLKLLGCSLEELKTHLQSQFKNGMNWDNYGEWEIDHIFPCSKFDLTDSKQQKLCFNYKNLQPLWAIDNLKKSNKI